MPLTAFRDSRAAPRTRAFATGARSSRYLVSLAPKAQPWERAQRQGRGGKWASGNTSGDGKHTRFALSVAQPLLKRPHPQPGSGAAIYFLSSTASCMCDEAWTSHLPRRGNWYKGVIDSVVSTTDMKLIDSITTRTHDTACG